jgi:hypothetical protein
MSNKLPEKKQLFEGKEQLKGQGTKDFLVDKELSIIAFAEANKDEDTFAVVLLECEGKEYTGAFGKAVLQRLKDAEAEYGVKQEGDEKYFDEPIDVTLRKVKSENGRQYFVIE